MRRYLNMAAAVLMFLFLSVPKASAQFDAILGAIFEAVEPQPVYDNNLDEQIRELNRRIGNLNEAFIGEESSLGAQRYKSLFNDISDLTDSFGRFVRQSYNNARYMESMYSELEESGLSTQWLRNSFYGGRDIYDYSYREGMEIIRKIRELLGNRGRTNDSVHQEIKETKAGFEKWEKLQRMQVRLEGESTQMAVGLVQAADFLSPSPSEYVRLGKHRYGSSLSAGGSLGAVGTAVMIIIGLLCVVFGLFAGFHIMKGTANAEGEISRLLIFYVVALVIIIALKSSI